MVSIICCSPFLFAVYLLFNFRTKGYAKNPKNLTILLQIPQTNSNYLLLHYFSVFSYID